MKKFLILLVCLILLFTACTTNDTNNQSDMEENDTTEEYQDTNNVEEENKNDEASEKEDQNKDLVSIIGGIYVGLADNNSAEFKIPGSKGMYKTIRITSEVKNKLETLNSNTMVSIYIKNNEETISKIEEVEFLNTRGEFTGTIDPHSVEFNINGNLAVFTIYDDVKADFKEIPVNSIVLFKYKSDKNIKANPIITEIMEWSE